MNNSLYCQKMMDKYATFFSQIEPLFTIQFCLESGTRQTENHSALSAHGIKQHHIRQG